MKSEEIKKMLEEIADSPEFAIGPDYSSYDWYEIISQLLKQNEELIKALSLIATAPYTQLPLPPELNMSKAIEVLMGISQLALKQCAEMENQ